MYASLKNWVNVPFSIKPFVKRTGTGDKVYGELVHALCYPHGEVTVTRNVQGIEVISNTQLYVDGSLRITELDEVIFEGKTLTIQSITTFYRNGLPDMRVVYI